MFDKVQNETQFLRYWNHFEVQDLLSELENPFRVMVLLDVTTGLRRSELFALKWKDIDFSNLIIEVQRSVFLGVVGDCKTITSRQPIPLSLTVAAELWLWKEATAYSGPDDWVFASPRRKGKRPLRPDVNPFKGDSTCSRAGRYQETDWLAYISSYLFVNTDCERRECEGGSGIMRHASSRFTLEVYTRKWKPSERLNKELLR